MTRLRTGTLADGVALDAVAKDVTIAEEPGIGDAGTMATRC
jgi:hypothetical protein